MLHSLHVEATSRCTLGCPRCERTNFIDKFGKNNFAINDLNINSFETFVDTKVKNINFCGNLGDPIYHRNFIDLVNVSKSFSETISITTNGSRKTKSWWKELVSILRTNDSVKFSIDGLPSNFDTYRINGDWKTIKQGIEICTQNNVKTTWKYIPMAFNENDIETAKALSKDLGIDYFMLDPSDRWEINDSFRPTGNYIGSKDEVKQNFKKYNKRDVDIDPECADLTMHYISADGLYAPCCHSKHYTWWYRSDWWKNKMSIDSNSLTDCIRRFEDFYATIQDSKPDYCLFSCGKC